MDQKAEKPGKPISDVILEQAADMVLHALWVGAVLTFAWWCGPVWWCGLLVGLVIGGVHEFITQRTPGRVWYKSGWSRWLDLMGFVVGGVLAGALAQSIADVVHTMENGL